MKASLSKAAIVAMANLLACSSALENSDDFLVTWKDRPVKDDMISEMSDLKYTKFIDHSKRPVIGVLTEPLRGDLYLAKDEYKDVIG